MSNKTMRRHLDVSEYKVVAVITVLLLGVHMACNAYMKIGTLEIWDMIVPVVTLFAMIVLQFILWRYYTRRTKAMETLFKHIDINAALTAHMQQWANEMRAFETKNGMPAVERPEANELLEAARELNIGFVYLSIDSYATHLGLEASSSVSTP